MSALSPLAVTPSELPKAESFLKPHRIVLILIFAGIILAAALLMRWDWLPKYIPRLGQGILVTLAMLFSTAFLGFLLAVPLGLAQVAGPWPIKIAASWFCTLISASSSKGS